ncbi:MAG: hypothetical protein RLZZ230_51 [Candidatus Parcubacteria bacterium]|jgi:hypothetical protein
MKENWEIPLLDNRVVCIANIESESLVAQISSLFARKGHYFPLYMFPNVNTVSAEYVDRDSDEFISNMIGNESAVFINNSIAKMQGAETYLFVGLSEFQKSYMSQYIKEFVEISDQSEIETKLHSIANLKIEILACKEDELLKGLYLACMNNKRLVVDNEAESLTLELRGKQGVVGVEKSREGHTSSIIGVNYAVSLDADLIILDQVSRQEFEQIERRLQRWKDENNHNHFRKVCNKAKNRLSEYDLSQYKYGTFFTEGIPYGLGIDNLIPTTHVHLHLRPDLFIINGIGTERGGRFHSAVVFSPQFFTLEETESVIEFLQEKEYYVRELVGEDATTQNLDFHAQHFPYDLLHICSHGGEMEGYEVTLKFKDRKGALHTIVYDEAVSFSPVPGKELISVLQKAFFRTLNGYKWMSPQLKVKNYPQYVYQDMFKAVSNDNTPRKKKAGTIPSAYAITTSDGFNQGAFKILSSHNNPIIFNNSCWSWGQIATHFIVSGARGYIGTLWKIGNLEANIAARRFYAMINDYSIMTCLHSAQQEIKGTESENVFHYWGLHFTSIAQNGVSEKESRIRVFSELLRAVFAWIDKVNTTANPTIRSNSIQVVHELHNELLTHFTEEDMANLEKKFNDLPVPQATPELGESDRSSVERKH